MRGESYETRENPKEDAWRREQQEVDKIVDKLGKPVDPGIKESVVALRVLGLATQASCEGHVDHGTKAPWVNVGPAIPQGLKDRLAEARKKGKRLDTELEKEVREMRMKILEQQSRLIELLAEFYRDRNVPFERHLILKSYPNHARLLNQGAELQDLVPPEAREEKLKEFQEELAAFTQFLKQKFSSQV